MARRESKCQFGLQPRRCAGGTHLQESVHERFGETGVDAGHRIRRLNSVKDFPAAREHTV